MSNFNPNSLTTGTASNGVSVSNGVLKILVDNQGSMDNYVSKSGDVMNGSLIFTNPDCHIVFMDGSVQTQAFGSTEVSQLTDASQSVQYIDCSESNLTKITSNLKVDGNVIINDGSLAISKVQNLQNNLNNISSNVSQNSNSINTINSTLTTLTNIDNVYSGRLTTLENYNTTNNNNINTINGRLTTTENAITGINSNISVIPNLTNRINTVENTTSSLNSTIDMLVHSTPNNQQITFLSNSVNLLTSNQSVIDDKVDVMEQDITNLQELTTTLDSQMATARTNIQSNTSNITSNTNNITTNTNNITSLTTQYNNLSSSTTSSLSNINSALTTANSNITSSTNEITNIKNNTIPNMELLINGKNPLITTINRLNMNCIGLGDISNAQLSTLCSIDTSRTIQSQINSLKNTVDSLGDLENLDITNISNIQTDITDLKTFKTNTISALSNLSSNSAVTQLQNDISDLNDTINTNQTNTNNSIDSISSQLTNKQNIINNNNKLDQSYVQVWNGENLAQALLRIDGTNSTQTNNITNLSNSLDTVISDLETANTNISNNSTLTTNNTNSINSLETTTTTQSASIQQLQSDLTQAQLDITSNYTSLNNDIGQLYTSITNHTNDIVSLNDSVSQIQSGLNNKMDTFTTLPSSSILNGSVPLNTVITNITNSISSLQQLQNGDTLSFATISDNFQTVENELNLRQASITELNKLDGNLVLYDSSNTLIEKIDNIYTTLDTLTGIDTTTLSSISSLSLSTDLNTSNITSLQSTTQQLQTGIDTNSTDISTINSTIQTMQQDIQLKQDIITELPITTITDLESSLSSITNNISNLQNSDTIISNNITNLTNSVNSINTSISNIETDIQNLTIPDPYSSTNKLPVSYINLGTSALSHVNISSGLQEQLNSITNDITSNENSISSLTSNLTTVSTDATNALNTANNAYDLALTKQATINNNNKIDGAYVQAPNGQNVVQAINSINSTISSMNSDISTAVSTANNAYDMAMSKQNPINSTHMLDGSYVQAPNGQNVVQAINSINSAISSLTGLDTSTLSSISDINTTLLDLQDQIDNLPSGGGSGGSGSNQAIDIIYNTTSNVSDELDSIHTSLTTLSTAIDTKQNILNNSTNKLPFECVEIENLPISYCDINSSLTQQLLTITNNVSNLSTSDSAQTTSINNLTSSVNNITNNKQDLISSTNKISSLNVSYNASTVSATLDNLTNSINTTNTNISNLTKSSVGLSNCDNTSDANKPISSAIQTALNLKSNINNPTFTTNITTPAVKITTGATNNYVLTSDSLGNGSWQAPQSVQPSSVVVSNYTTTIPDNCNAIYSYGYTPGYNPYYNPISFLGGTGNDVTYSIQCSTTDYDTGDVYFATNKVMPYASTNSRLYKYDCNTGRVIHLSKMLSGDIYCLLVYQNILYIGGNFTKYFAMYDISKNAFLNNLGNSSGGFNGIVYCMTMCYFNAYSPTGPRLWVGGAFTLCDGQSCNAKMAYYIPTTRVWTSINSGTTGGTIYSMCASNSPNLKDATNNGNIFVSGIFTSLAGVTTPPTVNFGMINGQNSVSYGITGFTANTTFNPNGYASSIVWDSANGRAILGGNFCLTQGTTMRFLCTLNTNSTTFTSFNFWNNSPTTISPIINTAITQILIDPTNSNQVLIHGMYLNSYLSGSNYSAQGNVILYNMTTNTYSTISGLANQNQSTYALPALSIAGDGLMFMGQPFGNNTMYANNGYAVMTYNNATQRIQAGELFEVKTYTVNGVNCVKYVKLNTNTNI